MPALALTVIKCGDTVESVRETYGDYDRMFALKLAGLELETTVVHAHRGAALPDVTQTEAVIITGSPFSVMDGEPWMVRLTDWTRALVDARRPLLGVCYGHQILAEACGGKVDVNPRGYEFGTIEVELTEAGTADPLFDGLGEPYVFQAVHGDAVVAMPEDGVVLAKNGRADVQAFRVGEAAWGVQFHPEFSHAFMSMYLTAREGSLRTDAERRGVAPDEAVASVLQSLAPAPLGAALLHRFIALAGEGPGA